MNISKKMIKSSGHTSDFCYKECPECLGSGAIFTGKDYVKCKLCKGNGMIINDKKMDDD